VAQFAAFESGFTGGVRVAAGELDGNLDTVEVVAAAGPGAGPRVDVFSVNVTTGQENKIASFFAFEPGFTGGVWVAVRETAGGARRDEIVVGADVGGGPRVRVFQVGANGQVSPATGPNTDFFAFDPNFRGGVRVAAGEMDGNAADGDELVVGAGPGGGARVRVLNAGGTELQSYFTAAGTADGVNVSVESTGGATGRIRTDQEAADFSQRSTPLNNLALPPTTTGTTGVGTTGPGITGTTTTGVFSGTTGTQIGVTGTGTLGTTGTTLGTNPFGSTGTGTGSVTGTGISGTTGGLTTSNVTDPNAPTVFGGNSSTAFFNTGSQTTTTGGPFVG